MISKPESQKKLQRLFKRETVTDLQTLFATLDTTSRMSVFRRLKPLAYLTSFTDAGRYYTLAEIPKFDTFGLWFYRGIGFSKSGTLKSTLVKIVNSSKGGMTPKELLNLMKLKIPNSLHNTLHGLAKSGQLHRQTVSSIRFYTSADLNDSEKQIEARRLKAEKDLSGPIVPPIETTIAVLVEALKAGPHLALPSTVSGRLSLYGLAITVDQVTQIYHQYGLDAEKKIGAQP